ncbi:hypothetical protein M422DRAFT_56246 [Sphaerobolus stellatus SS14]|uniref:Uncharacterized protein n=1 Tax=Sphaerobolus stellatus (strain SS14) TaxID=990650 RepID=A0A0C9U6U8_SPHS4|nr:hypothetical protein M422DRAFT_56246 [Sphaerobolus stellatus SS14]
MSSSKLSSSKPLLNQPVQISGLGEGLSDLSDLSGNDSEDSDDSSASGQELVLEIEEDDPDMIALEDEDTPLIHVNRREGNFSLLDHSVQNHGLLDAQGISTIHLYCLGCTQAAFLSQMEYEPEALFTKVEFKEAVGAIQNAMANPPQSQYQGSGAPTDATQLLQPGPPTGHTSKKCRSDTDLDKHSQRAAEHHAAKKANELAQEFSEIVAQSQRDFPVPGLSLQETAPCGFPSTSSSSRMEEIIDRAEAPHNQFVKRSKSQKKVVSWATQVGEEEITDFPVNGDIFLTPHETYPAGHCMNIGL